ncbi:Pkinase-domain-containing protein [Dichomitus squalens]|uniref:non-specific serine/threonine protein kinase n=1 Tax=Dichomitus squalens TaxID=114155 RepID=A0A4V2K0X5_9APHY|nr:Pkinase-domain-containing protein [Dichomitus squalens]TBU42392.1 Pkinase-domain-containing protein [Dichomitus squalens]TBU61003.1 Pkinase-domain-containing protein [Dichomitus squalens]
MKRDGDPKMIGLWKVGRTIGKGSSAGRVRLARHSKTGQYAAVKIVSKTALLNSRMSLHDLGEEADRILHSIEREIVIMKLIEHPNIMRLYDVWETSTELYLILEYVEGGELFEYLCDKGRLSAPEAIGYFQQIIMAIDYCHRFNIAHRDLKPENLLLDRHKNIKVADFGMAVWQGAGNMLNTACGSPHYAAPEVIKGEAYDGTAADIWSCGVILYALLVGRLPFDDEDLPVLLEKVKAGRFTIPNEVDARAHNLIRRMLEKDVNRRITIPEILRHPFYKSQKPKPMNCDVPKLDEIARPLTSKDEIDRDIFANLRTLWPGAKDEQIQARLMDGKPSWEKGVYQLLVQYRAKHSEDYDEDQERALVEKREKRRKAKQDAETRERVQLLAELPPRAGPPTPTRARTGVARRSPSPSPTRAPGGMQKVSFLSLMDGSLPPLTSTPVTTGAPSPDPPSLQSPRPQSQLPPIEVPQVEDQRVQEFLNQIAQQLVTIQASNMPIRDQGNYDHVFSPLMASLAPLTPMRQFGDQIKASTNGQDPFLLGEEPKQTRPLSIRRRNEPDADKENASIKPRPTLKVDTGASENRPSLLEPPDDRGRLKKRRSPMLSPAWPASAFSEGSFVLPSTPKRKWLGALFRFKPASYQLLSTKDAEHTHATCRKLLEDMGVVVSGAHYVSGSDALTLECTLADSRERDEDGVLAAVKSVRFRVEIGRPSPVHELAGFTVVVQLALEKGAASSLKLLYGRLRRDWNLDSAPVACESLSTRELEGGRFLEVVFSH